MDPNKKEQAKKTINKSHAQNNQDQDAPNPVQEIDAMPGNEYLPAEESRDGRDKSIDRDELKKTLELDDDMLEDRDDDQVN